MPPSPAVLYIYVVRNARFGKVSGFNVQLKREGSPNGHSQNFLGFKFSLHCCNSSVQVHCLIDHRRLPNPFSRRSPGHMVAPTCTPQQLAQCAHPAACRAARLAALRRRTWLRPNPQAAPSAARPASPRFNSRRLVMAVAQAEPGEGEHYRRALLLHYKRVRATSVPWPMSTQSNPLLPPARHCPPAASIRRDPSPHVLDILRDADAVCFDVDSTL